MRAGQGGVPPGKGTNGKSPMGVLRTVHIRINGIPPAKLDVLERCSKPTPAPARSTSGCSGDTRQKVVTQFKVEPTSRFVTEVERILGRDVVRLA